MNLISWIDERKETFSQLSDEIWKQAEVAFHEYHSSELLAGMLERSGFSVERGVAGIPTAFIASYGSAKPVVALLGEFDALPGLSQQVATEKKPLQAGCPGHGCGHNLLGVGCLAAALALKEAIYSGELAGTVRYYGCPAEENGSGKAFMVKEGAFSGVDLALTWHPDMVNLVFSLNVLANYKVKFRFTGISAHAAADPYNGRSALDAVELMNVGINYLREHIIPDARVHYAVINTGGPAPNVVQPEAESLYLVRAPRVDQLEPIYQRVLDIARGAALMTGTELEVIFHAGASNLLINRTISDTLYQSMVAVGSPKFTVEEKHFAAKLQQTFPKGVDPLDGIDHFYGPGAREKIQRGSPELFEDILPTNPNEVVLYGSTDVGDVSWVAPTGQIFAVCEAIGSPGHSWQIVSQSGMSIGHKGMLFAAKTLALTAAQFFNNPALVVQARAEFENQRKDRPYLSPIPDGVDPPLED